MKVRGYLFAFFSNPIAAEHENDPSTTNSLLHSLFIETC